MAKTPKRIVIAGLPRCGTTLLASLLNQQPGCRFVTDYSNWFRDAQERLGIGWTDPLTLAQQRVCLALAREEWVRHRHPVLIRSFSTVDELHRGICGELAGDAVAVGHKSTLMPEQIVATSRDTTIFVIVMVRDPRAAALSFWHRTGQGVESYVQRWKQTVTACFSSERSNLLVVRFEDLIDRPKEVLGRITASWGAVPEIPAQLTFGSGSSRDIEWRDNSSYHDIGSRFDRRALERWRSESTSPIARYADVTCRTQMARLGYRALPLPRSDVLRMRFHEWVTRLDRQVEQGLSRARSAIVRTLAPPLSPTPDSHEAKVRN